MTTIVFKSIEVSGKWAVFADGEDLTEYAPEDVQEWAFETKPVTTGSLIRTMDGVGVRADSLAYPLAYNLAFADEHCTGITGPLASHKPNADFWESFPTTLLLAYVARADTTRGMSEAERASKKRPTPTGSESGASV